MKLQDFNSYTFFPGQHWTHTWERQHELVTRFATELAEKKINVCSPLGLLNHNPFSKHFFEKIGNYWKSQAQLSQQNPVCANMHMVNKFHIPYHNNIIGRVNYELLKNDMGMTENNFFWSTYMNPTLYEFFKRSKFKVYDLAERRTTNPNLNERIRNWEKTAVKEADLVIVDNHATFDDYRDLNKNIYYIPQGVNLDSFYSNSLQNREYIGYIGNLHFAIDYIFFEELIKLNPNEKFLIIGSILEKEGHSLIDHPNVTYIPQIPKTELNQYLQKMKVGLIPYVVNDHTVGVYPTKLFEYLASGVPVLSTPLPEVLQYQKEDYLIIKTNPENLSNLKFSMRGINEVILNNTWDARWETYKKHINSLL